MQLSTTILATLATASQLATAASVYNAAVDACMPPAGAYRGKSSPDFLACPVTSAARPWSRHDCAGRGYIVYDYVSNTYRINSATPQGNRLTFHAQCTETKNGIARPLGHFDISTPPPSDITWSRLYKDDTNAPCNIESPGTTMEIYSWTMARSQYIPGCVSHPISGKKA